MTEETEYINVYGARVHNLKNIDAEIPRNSLTVITGLSGSGKSSLASTRFLPKDNVGISKPFLRMPVISWEIWSVPTSIRLRD